jgi:L-threonylcarbamoyladenylate synthase
MRPHIIWANKFTIYFVAFLLIMGFNVALPTETVYGLFAVYWNASAVQGIYDKKGRSMSNPLIVHISVLENVYRYELTRMSKKEDIIFKLLAQNFWPGPCTFVVRANTHNVIPMIRNHSPFVAIRTPDNEVIMKVLRLTGPSVGPSANRSGKISPTKGKHVFKDYFDHSIFMPILQSFTKKPVKAYGIESTIIQIVETDTGDVNIKLLRAGTIGTEQIRDCLAKHTFDFNYTIDVNIDCVNHNTSVAPGQEITHYAPDTTTFIGDKNSKITLERKNAVLVATKEIVDEYSSNYNKCFILPPTDEECASVLYDIMREADAYCKENLVCTIVICEQGLRVVNQKSGNLFAIHDKLVRASSGMPCIRV